MPTDLQIRLVRRVVLKLHHGCHAAASFFTDMADMLYEFLWESDQSDGSDDAER